MSKSDGKIIAIKFTLPLVGDVSGNESAFTITGKEYLYTDGSDNNGVLVDKTYTIVSTQTHPTETKTIQLLLSKGFNNAVGNMTVKYNQTNGNLAGSGGIVESFEEIFSPTELVEQGNPRVREYISATVDATIMLVEIVQFKAYSREYISASIDGTIEFIYVGDVNP